MLAMNTKQIKAAIIIQTRLVALLSLCGETEALGDPTDPHLCLASISYGIKVISKAKGMGIEILKTIQYVANIDLIILASLPTKYFPKEI